MDSEELYRKLRECLRELRTEKEFYRWAERYINQMPFPVLEGKKLLLRLHKESSNIYFIDLKHECMIFECLHKAWRQYEANQQRDTRGDHECRKVSAADVAKSASRLSRSLYILLGTPDEHDKCEPSTDGNILMAEDGNENMPPTEAECHEISSAYKEYMQTPKDTNDNPCDTRVVRVQCDANVDPVALIRHKYHVQHEYLLHKRAIGSHGHTSTIKPTHVKR